MVCSTPITGAEIAVFYAIIGLPRGKAGLQFSAGNHLIAGRFSNVSIAVHEEKNFTIRKSENQSSRYSISFVLKTAYPSPIAQNKLLEDTFLPAFQSEPNSRISLERGLPQTPPPPSTREVATSPSTKALDSSNVSISDSSNSAAPTLWKVQVNVFNDTHYTWQLDEKGVEAGAWHTEPGVELSSFSRNSWKCLPSEGSGTLGYAKYHCTNQSNLVFFTKWDCKPSQKPRVDAVLNGPNSRAVDCEVRISHTTEVILVDVTIFAEGSYHKSPAELRETKYQVTSSVPSSSVSLKVFRLPIEVLVDREYRTGVRVPWIVEALCKWLVDCHTTTAHLFTAHARYFEVKAIKSMIEDGSAIRRYETEGHKIFEKFDPASVLSIFKLFLRELPAPLVPHSSIRLFTTIESNESASSYIDDGNFPLLISPAYTPLAITPRTSIDGRFSESSSSDSSTQSLLSSAQEAAQLTEKANASLQAQNLESIGKFLRSLPMTNAATLLYIAKNLAYLWKAPGSVHTLDAISIVFGPIIAPDKPDGSLKSTLPVISSFQTLLKLVDLLPST